MTDDVDAFPLSWPVGWPRAKYRERARFGTRKGGEVRMLRALTIGEGRDHLLLELERLGATAAVVSTNAPLRLDGRVRGDASNPADPGAAAYFRFGGKPHVLACDKWDRLADNLAALAKHVEAMRGMDRWGVGSLSQAFAGYKALAAMGERAKWWQVLGFQDNPVGRMHVSEMEAKYLELMQRHHPDKGGNGNQAAEINAAWQEAREEMGL